MSGAEFDAWFVFYALLIGPAAVYCARLRRTQRKDQNDA